MTHFFPTLGSADLSCASCRRGIDRLLRALLSRVPVRALGRQVDLGRIGGLARRNRRRSLNPMSALERVGSIWLVGCGNMGGARLRGWLAQGLAPDRLTVIDPALPDLRSEEHTSELQSLMRNSYAVFC